VAGGGIECKTLVAVGLVFVRFGVGVVAIVVGAAERPYVAGIVKRTVGVIVSARSGGEVQLYQEVNDREPAYNEGEQCEEIAAGR
jgi:hypothetical protein